MEIHRHLRVLLSGRRAKVQIITLVATEDWDYMAVLRLQSPTR